MRWYVLQVMTGEEETVKKRIVRDIYGVNALVPKQAIMERHQGVWKEVTRVLFPSYVFVQMTMDEKSYYTLKDLPYVLSFLGSKGPEPVPDNQMSTVMWLCSDDEVIGISTIEVGQDIKVISGPLKGMYGQIIKLNKRKRRARVRITLFQVEKEIDLGIEFIQASE